jgi:glycosyltransferase involved in cell wall biosynthesis
LTGPPETKPGLVSVVIPVHDRLRYLPEAVASVLAQTHPHREVVVVDDGSSVDVEASLRSFGAAVRLFRQENQGLGAARNAGMRNARGEYLLFLDDDDALEPTALHELLTTLHGFPGAGWAAGRFSYVDEEGKPRSLRHRGVVTSGDIYPAMIQDNQFGAPCTVLLKRVVAEAAGAFVTDACFRGCEDYDFWLSVARDWPLAASEHIVARYRLHSSNMSRNQDLILGSQLLVLERQRRRARPGFEAQFDEAMARVHFERGDILYKGGRSAEARAEWRASTLLVARSRAQVLSRVAKSYIPSSVRQWLRSWRRGSVS